jgi:hypothetical protein
MVEATDEHRVERIDGRLHAVRHIFDEAGRVVGTITTPRVLVAYLTTFLVASFLLCLVDKGSFSEPLVLWKRAVLVAFPASFAAATFDYIK